LLTRMDIIIMKLRSIYGAVERLRLTEPRVVDSEIGVRGVFIYPEYSVINSIPA
jgi:hypothetical protein